MNRGLLVWIVIGVIGFVFLWAPWMDNRAIEKNMLDTRARIDGTIDRQTGEIICPYKSGWAPFGRWVGSCEAGYYVTFWNKIL